MIPVPIKNNDAGSGTSLIGGGGGGGLHGSTVQLGLITPVTLPNTAK
jgi:hypothetical protein